MLGEKIWKLLLITSVLAAPLVLADTEIVSRRRRAATTEPDYKLKLGELRVDAAFGLVFAYDDNTNRSPDNDTQEEGLLAIAKVPLRIYWPISPDLTLDLNGVFGYRDYISGDGSDGIFINLRAPETFAIDAKVGDNGTLSFIDTLMVNVDTIQENPLNNTEDLVLLQNDAAIQYEVDLSSQLSATIRGGRKDTRSLHGDKYDYREKHVYYGTGYVGYQLSSDLKLGPYAAYRDYTHEDDLNNDAEEIEAGIRGQYALSDATTASFFVGYQYMDFDLDSTPAALEDDGEGPTAGIKLASLINENLTQTALVRYSQRIGTNPLINYSEDVLVAYYLSCQLNSSIMASLGVDYLHSDEQSPFGEESDTVSPNLTLKYAISDALASSLRYDYTAKTSDVDDRDYRRNLVSLGLTWDF